MNKKISLVIAISIIVGVAGTLLNLIWFNLTLLDQYGIAEIKTFSKGEWLSYRDQEYGVTLEYPSSWALQSGYGSPRFFGKTGFVQIAAISSPTSLYNAASNEMNNLAKPYGTNPIMRPVVVNGVEGYRIYPDSDQLETNGFEMGSFVFAYASPLFIQGDYYNYFIVWADPKHIGRIGNSIKFSP